MSAQISILEGIANSFEQDIQFDLRMYCIKDIKVGKFGVPFLATNDEEAKRIFSDLVLGSSESLIAKHPEDYDFYYLGVFDSRTGQHTCTTINYLLNAQSVIEDARRKYQSFLRTPNPDENISS